MIEAVSAGKAVSSVYRMIFQTYVKEDVMRLAGTFTGMNTAARPCRRAEPTLSS